MSLIDLPDDRIAGFEGADGEAERPSGLHYAPLGVAAIRTRMARLAAWIEDFDPVLMIVDVSVEVALFARLMSVPTLVVRLAGERTDEPHLEAFRGATRLLAPFPTELDDPGLPAWIRAKTVHMGFLSGPVTTAPAQMADKTVVVLFGAGGHGGEVEVLAAAARAVPDAQWHVLGPVAGAAIDLPPNLRLHGWVDAVDGYIAEAALVIGAGGDGTLAAVAAHGKRFICIPEPRPFGEQAAKARALARLGAAVLHEGWSVKTDWMALVRSGLALDPSVLARLADPAAVRRTAVAIEVIAAEIDDRPRHMGQVLV